MQLLKVKNKRCSGKCDFKLQSSLRAIHVMPLLKADASSSDSMCDSPGKQQFLSPANACLQTILIIIISYCVRAGERIMFKCPNSYDRDCR